MTGAESAHIALEPLRDGLLHGARADADEAVRLAEHDAAVRLDEARAQAEAILGEARARGAADADEVLAAARTQARRTGRAVELAARRDARLGLRSAVVAGVQELRNAPDYPVIRDGLAARARRLLGPGALIEDSPDGGVRARADGRYADLSLATIAVRALDRDEMPETPAPEGASTAAALPRVVGRIRRVSGPLVEVDLAGHVAMSDLVSLGDAAVPGEIVAIADGVVTVQAYEYTGGLEPGAPAVPTGRPLSARLGPGLLGGIFDGLLRPLAADSPWLTGDGRGARPDTRTWQFVPQAELGRHAEPGRALGVLADAGPVEHRVLTPPGVTGRVDWIAGPGVMAADALVARIDGIEVRLTGKWPIRRPRPCRRVDATEPLHTGQRAVDLLFPVAKGSTAAVPGGFGTGKTMLLQQIAKWCDADVIVYVGCGERGNEMADVVAELSELEDPRTGGRLAERTVVIANTSNMPMMAREASVYSGVCVAEYFRDMGHDVVVIADSTSRWAEALREFASRSGALPAEEGYPADLASALAAFYERAGAVTLPDGRQGSVTVIGAVSPPGGDLAEPVTAHTERFVRCRWTLDRDLAYARHYPAVSWAGSFSRDAETLAVGHVTGGDPGWPARRARIIDVLARADRLADLVDLVGLSALPGDERMAVLAGRLVREGLLQQSSLSANDAQSPEAKTVALADAVLAVADHCRALAEAGADPAAIEGVDFGPLLRAREEAGPRDTARVEANRDLVVGRLDGLTSRGGSG